MKNALVANSTELKSMYTARLSQECEDPRKEVRGHDFVYYLYYCAKKMKSKMSMNNEEFANMFWQFADFDSLKKEPLFERIFAL